MPDPTTPQPGDLIPLRVRSGRAAWPYAFQGRPLPESLPSGAPWPKISVVTPSFNQGRFIEETILSVLHQGYPNLEYIVVDGGSTDETLAVVGRYRDRLTHFESQRDRGQSHAINKGFARATGEILTWLNSDDQFAPGALAAAALAFHTSKADLVAGVCEIFKAGAHVQSHLTGCPDGPLPLDDLLDLERGWLAGRFFYQPEVLFTRDAWQRAGGRVDESLFYSMDYELWLRMAHAGARLHVIGRPIAHFRSHEDQKTQQKHDGGYIKELPKVASAFCERTGCRPRAIPTLQTKRRLKVAMVNDLGYAYGAGIAHRRVAQALRLGGHHVVALAAGSAEHGIEAPKVSTTDLLTRLRAIGPDAVVLGNLHGAGLDASALSSIASEFPAAFMLHDQWLLTGRCAYTGGCEHYRADRGGCSNACTCPAGHLKSHAKEIAPAWQGKRDSIQASPKLALWANSRWMQGNASEALPPDERAKLATITFGFELETFRPMDKLEARERLGLPKDRFIVFSAVSSLADERKGLGHLARAMEILRLDDTLVASVGWFGKNQEPPISGMRPLGYTKDPLHLATCYAAADVFVGPSLEEAFGQVFIEAAACGTPSIGYPVGGVPEAILHGVSGLIAERREPEALAEAIRTLYLDPTLRERMGCWARLWAENQWSMTSSYRSLYLALRESAEQRGWVVTPKIDLAIRPEPVPMPAMLSALLPAWRVESGMDPWEGPYPQKHLHQRFRWTVGPIAKLVLQFDGAPTSSDAAPAQVLIACKNFHPSQRLRLVVNGQSCGERDVPARANQDPETILRFDTALRLGENTLEIHTWKWGGANREIGVMVSSIVAVPVGRGTTSLAQAGSVEAKPLVASR